MAQDKYSLPPLPYGKSELSPFLSEEQLTIHYEKHHNAYVVQANAIIGMIEAARSSGADVDMKAVLENLSFNLGGHILHTLYWGNLAPVGSAAEPSGRFSEAIMAEFGGIERFKKEFTQTAMTVEGSGWAALGVCPETGRLILIQIEKHNVNLVPGSKLILVLDMFEHAYYIDYKNDKARYIDSFWSHVNWAEAERRLAKL